MLFLYYFCYNSYGGSDLKLNKMNEIFWYYKITGNMAKVF